MPKLIEPSQNTHQWPRKSVNSVECRKRDVVVRIANWWSDKDEPAFYVEVYIGGVYDWNESRSFTRSTGLGTNGEKTGGYSKSKAKAAAAEFAAKQIAKFL